MAFTSESPPAQGQKNYFNRQFQTSVAFLQVTVYQLIYASISHTHY